MKRRSRRSGRKRSGDENLGYVGGRSLIAMVLGVIDIGYQLTLRQFVLAVVVVLVMWLVAWWVFQRRRSH